MLKVSENSKVELTFVDFKVEYHGECAYDFVEGTYYDNMILPFLYITFLALSGAQEMQNLCLFSPSLSRALRSDLQAALSAHSKLPLSFLSAFSQLSLSSL